MKPKIHMVKFPKRSRDREKPPSRIHGEPQKEPNEVEETEIKAKNPDSSGSRKADRASVGDLKSLSTDGESW